MKKTQIFGIIILLTCILFSCSVSEKVEGVYNGHWGTSSTSYTITIITNGSDKVDIQTGSGFFGTNAVNVSTAGTGVTFSYNNPDAVNHADIISIQGSYLDNHLTISFEIVYTSLPYTQTSTFEGEKQ